MRDLAHGDDLETASGDALPGSSLNIHAERGVFSRSLTMAGLRSAATARLMAYLWHASHTREYYR
ncbi:MAG: hypothetical protein AB7L13_11230 [Acidimicrobiia bacterium]